LADVNFNESAVIGITGTVQYWSGADRDEVHLWMLDHFVRVSKRVGNSEMFGCFVSRFLAASADRRDLELRKRVAHTCSNDANTIFSVAMMFFP
jgi:hypothetical protein